MRRHRSARLALVALLGALIAVAAPVDAIASASADDSPSPSPSASAQPSPSVSPEPTPDPSPSPSPSPSPDPGPSVGPSPSPSPSPTDPPTPGSPAVHGVRVLPWLGVIPAAGRASAGDAPSPLDQLEGGSAKHERTPDLSTEQLLSGTFSSERLVVAATRLRAAGWSQARIRREVYAPFILVGPASWSDSWHAPRYGPGPIVRQHEGQDVLCRYGAEVLAPADGTIAFDTGLLGGRSAHLYLPDGGFYYFAHFVRWNDRRFSNGDEVHRGDVIGYCGDTGNATVPHVHFGHYGPDGTAIDPMRSLVSWLRAAENDLPGTEPGGTAAAALAAPGPTLDIVRSLHDAPIPEGRAIAWRNVGWREPYGAIDLTPVLVFLVLFGIGRRTVPGSRRRRAELRAGSPPSSAMWPGRRGPVVP
jgi:murein DD-endopeptidase MepM/ murein hydrolase activator NlpD